MTDSPPSVLFVLSEAGTGGMQAVVGMLAAGLAERGWRVDIAAGGTAAMPAVLDRAVADHPEVTLHRLASPAGAAGMARWTAGLARLVWRLRPDQIHGHGLRTAWPLVLVSRRRPARILVTCHGLPRGDLARTARLVRAAGVTVASVGPGLTVELAAAGIDAVTLENGVPAAPVAMDRHAIADQFGIDARAPLVVCPARLSPQKDPITLVAAMSHVPDASLLLVGGGPLEEQVAEVSAELGLEGRVVVTGWHDDARAILGAGDLLAMASRWEGQALVMMEAAAAGVPIVSTACPGVEGWLVDGRDALLSPVGNPAALGQNINAALFDPEVRATLIDGAASLALRHSLARMIDAHMTAYGSLGPG
jgi:glycosyltransferase involved in cell wall biosynthesis